MAFGPVDDSAKERLSALADGELDGSEPAAAFAAWARDPGARRDWHAWHLIGDVLRSQELASDPHQDRQRCAAICARLEREPVVLAPVRLAAPGRLRWTVGAAVAAGFVLVVGTFTLLRPGDSPAPAAIARADRAPAATVAALVGPSSLTELPAATQPVASSEAVVADMRLIRDAQLDRYLAAHKQFTGSSALGVPSAFLRSATVETAPR